jgi:hypothetical protein
MRCMCDRIGQQSVTNSSAVFIQLPDSTLPTLPHVICLHARLIAQHA